MNFFPALLAFFCLLQPAAASAKPITVEKPAKKAQRLFVLAVGINQYEDSFFPPLRWAEQDAERFATAVGRDNGYEVKREVLTGSKVTKESVQKAIANIAKAATGRDVVLVYLSSHGSLKVGGSGELEPVIVLPGTSSKELAATTLAHKSLMRWIDGVPARKKIVITASCHSGVGKSRLTPAVREALAQAKGIPDLENVSEGVLILTAAAKNEVALEDNKYRSDLYTHFFLEALTVYDRNQDGAVSVLEAHDYATEKAFKASGGRQRPTIQAQVIGDVDIPLRGLRRKKGLPVLEGYAAQYSGMEIEVNQQEKGRLPFAFPLKTGRNNIVLYSQDREEKIGEYSMTAREGQSFSVDDVLKGHPFSAGPYFARIQPSGQAYRKLLGGGNLRISGGTGAWRSGRIELGLNLQMPVYYDAEILEGLKASANQQMVTLSSGFRLLQFGKYAVVGHLVAGQDQFNLQIKDQTTGYSESVSSSALILGGRASFLWNPIDLILLSLDAEQQNIKHDFNQLGTVDASRRIFLLTMRFTFGGIARRK